MSDSHLTTRESQVFCRTGKYLRNRPVAKGKLHLPHSHRRCLLWVGLVKDKYAKDRCVNDTNRRCAQSFFGAGIVLLRCSTRGYMHADNSFLEPTVGDEVTGDWNVAYEHNSLFSALPATNWGSACSGDSRRWPNSSVQIQSRNLPFWTTFATKDTTKGRMLRQDNEKARG